MSKHTLHTPVYVSVWSFTGAGQETRTDLYRLDEHAVQALPAEPQDEQALVAAARRGEIVLLRCLPLAFEVVGERSGLVIIAIRANERSYALWRYDCRAAPREDDLGTLVHPAAALAAARAIADADMDRGGVKIIQYDPRRGELVGYAEVDAGSKDAPFPSLLPLQWVLPIPFDEGQARGNGQTLPAWVHLSTSITGLNITVHKRWPAPEQEYDGMVALHIERYTDSRTGKVVINLQVWGAYDDQHGEPRLALVLVKDVAAWVNPFCRACGARLDAPAGVEGPARVGLCRTCAGLA